MLRAIFGAAGQMVVGVLMVVATVAQTVYWLKINPPPGDTAIFIVSMEALLFAAYGVFGTALGHRATERVEQHIEADIDVDVDVNGPDGPPAASATVRDSK